MKSKFIMKPKLIFFLLAPFLMAFQCEEEELECAGTVEFTNNFGVSVENLNETYVSDETIWFNGEVSSELINICDGLPEIILDEDTFVTGFFVLKLTNSLVDLNAEVVQNYDVTYNIGEELITTSCAEFVYLTPELSDDNLSYNYRVGISLNDPGDYAVVATFANNFEGFEQNNNAEIFDLYNTLNNTIKFTSCDLTYTRTGTNGHYFFSVN